MSNLQRRFVWYELMTTDIEAAKAFYTSVVGWGTKDASVPSMPYTLFTIGGTSVGGLMVLSDDARTMGATPSWIGYVDTDDIEAATDRIKQLGGTVHVPPMDISDVSRFSIVADPQMAPLGLLKWLIPREEYSVKLGTPGHVGWYDLFSSDTDRALHFYGEICGWQKAGIVNIDRVGTYHLLSSGGEMIGGIVKKPPKALSSFWLYYFAVEDVNAAARRVEAGGGQILYGPMEGPGGSWIIHCTDPEGVMFALVGGGRACTYQVRWSSEWGELSLHGQARITKVAPPRGEPELHER